MFSRLLVRPVCALKSRQPVALAAPTTRVSARYSTASGSATASRPARAITEAEVEAMVAMTNPTSDVADKLAAQDLASAKPSDVIAANYIDWLYTRSQQEQAVAHFDAFRAKAQPSARMYVGAIRSAAQLHNHQRMQQYMDQWKSDPKSQPTARIYATLIGATLTDATVKDPVARAQALFDEAKQRFPPNNLVYHSMMLVYLSQNRSDQAQALLSELKEKGVMANPLTLAMFKRQELLASLPKLKKKKRSPQQVADSKTVTGAKFLQGIELVKAKEQLLNKIRGKELARRVSPPKKPDNYIELSREQLPADWSDADKAAALQAAEAHNKTVTEQAVAEQKKPPEPRMPRLGLDQVRQNLNYTFYWLLYNHLRFLHISPERYSLSSKSVEMISKYFASIMPKKKAH